MVDDETPSTSSSTLPAPVVAGFDFSFGVPAWFAPRTRLRVDRRRLGAGRVRRRTLVGTDRAVLARTLRGARRATVPRVRDRTATRSATRRSRCSSSSATVRSARDRCAACPTSPVSATRASRSGRSTTPAIASRSRSTRACCGAGSPRTTPSTCPRTDARMHAHPPGSCRPGRTSCHHSPPRVIPSRAWRVTSGYRR